MTGYLSTTDTYLAKNKIVFPLILLLIGIAVYLPSINIFYINDEIAFIERTKVNNLFDLFSFFNFQNFDGSYYRPIGNIIAGKITFFTNQNLVLIRLFNILIHILNAFLVYQLGKRLLKNLEYYNLLSAMAAIIFLVHPLHDYAVIWHTALFERAMTAFYLIALVFFIDKKILLSLFFAVLAILSKEMAFSIPLVVLVIAVYNEIDKKEIAFQSLLFFAAAITIILIRIFFLNNNFLTSPDTHPNAGILTIFKNIFLFAGLVFYPLNIDDVKTFIQNNAYIIYVVIILLVCISFLFYKFVNNKKQIILLILLFILMILPASRLLMRWYDYLPSVALCLLIPVVLFELKRIKSIAAVILILFVVVEIFSLVKKEFAWKEVSISGKELLSNFVNEYKEHIAGVKEIEFVNLPAKVNEIPLFQLGFYDHINYFLKEKKNVSLFSKMYMYEFNNEMMITKNRDTISISLNRENYFILSHNEKYVNFNDVEKTSKINYLYKPSRDKLIVLYKNGRFEKI
ncbi:MAG TPA: hypothetical protein VFF33_14645 [Ignavibacteriaceae bacterium]|nr:hypothetical protein [Ignavibacteriaceae bacterium]